MVASLTPFSPDLPPEAIAAVEADADRMAQWVVGLLATLGEKVIPKQRLTASFLLRLAAALRLYSWEAEGFFFHREVGLPGAEQALREAITPGASAADATDFCLAVQTIALQRFAWGGQLELGADVAAGVADEEALLEALADFLWAHRPR